MAAYPYAIQRNRYDSPMPTSYRRWTTSNGPIENSLGQFVEVTNPNSGAAWRLLQMVRAKHGRHGKRTPKGVIPELLAAMEEARFKIITKSTMGQSCVLTRPEYDSSTNSRDLFPTGQLYDDAKHHAAEAVRQNQLVAITADIVAAQCSPGIREALIEGMLEAANESRNVHQIALLPVTIDTAIEVMRGQHGANTDTHWDRGKAPRYKDSLRAARMLSSLFQQNDKKAPKQDRPDNVLGRMDNPWGDATMQTPRLDATCKSSRAARAFRATDEGYLFKYPHRWATDRNVWATSRRKRTGSVLVDCSGSMGFTSEELDEIMAKVPAATIATYAGNSNQDRGWVRIVASGGKRLGPGQSLDPPGANGANVIDGPALQWLATQTHPRVWLSDGWVVGRDGNTDPSLSKECTDLQRAARIVRADDLPATLLALRGARHA